MKPFSKNLVAASLTFGLVLTVVVETQAGSRFGGSRGSSSRGSISRSSSSRSSGRSFGSRSSSSRTRSSPVRRITPTRTQTRTQTRTPIRTRTPTRNVVKRPTTRLPTKRPSSPLKQGVKKSSFFGGHHNNHNGHNGHHNSHHNNHGHRRHFWFNFGRHVYYRPYIRNYCWGYVPRCNPTYYNFCEPTYGVAVAAPVVQQPAPNVIVENPNQPAVQPNATPADVRPVDATRMVGVWTAKPAEGVVITATLKADGTFTWDMASGDQKQSIAGAFEMKGNQLILNREDGQKLEGAVKLTGEKSFNFKAKGSNADDPGLNFAG